MPASQALSLSAPQCIDDEYREMAYPAVREDSIFATSHISVHSRRKDQGILDRTEGLP